MQRSLICSGFMSGRNHLGSLENLKLIYPPGGCEQDITIGQEILVWPTTAQAWGKNQEAGLEGQRECVGKPQDSSSKRLGSGWEGHRNNGPDHGVWEQSLSTEANPGVWWLRVWVNNFRATHLLFTDAETEITKALAGQMTPKLHASRRLIDS